MAELQRLKCPETPVVLAVLVLEDLAMAVYLPLVAVLLVAGEPLRIAVSVSIAVATVSLVLAGAIRYGNPLSGSAVIGAFLAGIAVSGQMAEQSHRLLSPLRDLFAGRSSFSLGLRLIPPRCRQPFGPLCHWPPSPRSQKC
jgi:CPA2 family monovalent cation:H+ antiporter-2